MKRITAALASVTVAGLAALFAATPAQAAENEPIPVVSDCIQGWYVNPDEGGADPNQGDRRPTQTPEGLKFEGNQLIHHSTNLPVADLEPGTYVAAPAPSLDSFFSVEVANDPFNGDFSGYATLRWDVSEAKWNIGGTAFFDADPSALVAAHSRGTVVFSFGVGYVNTPNDGTVTTVSSITFAGQTYDLTCKPTETETSTPTETSPGPTTTAGGGLPETGPNLTWVLVTAVALILVGAAALLVGRHRAHE